MTFAADQPLFYCGDELHHWKQQRIQQEMRENGYDALLFLKHDAVRYVTEFYAKGYRPFLDFDYFALVPLGREPIIGYSVGGEDRRIDIRGMVGESRLLPSFTDWGLAIGEVLSDYELTHNRIGFDILPSFLKEDLERRLPELDLVDVSGLWSELTAIKHPREVTILRQALKIAEQGLDAAKKTVRPGVREIEVAAVGEYEMRRLGSEMTPFLTVVSSGENAAVWERVATSRQMQNGEMVILDFGCVHSGYTGDFARTTVIGEPSTAQQKLYTVAYEALQSAIEAIKPGALCSEIDAIVRRKVTDSGYAKYVQPWASGHQLGYGLHGSPMLQKGVDVPLQAGMVINIEPSLYTYDDLSIGGVELEDTVLVTENGCERLTDYPYDTMLLGN